jgi:hypothetical protein
MAAFASETSFEITDLLQFFPVITLPVTLGEDTHHDFSQHNEPLPGELVRQFLPSGDSEPDDEEVTEYVPCFRIEDAGNFYTLVYWRAALLSYSYHLATFSARGDLIDHKIIAGTFYAQSVLTQSMATISEAHIIYIVMGQSAPTQATFDAGSSAVNHLRITEEGTLEEVIIARK